MPDLSEYNSQLKENYELEIDRVIKEIKKQKAKIVCLQFPEGLKSLSTEIAQEIENKTKSEVLIWIDSCFGACDTPVGLENFKVDLLVQWGHASWNERNK